MWVRGLGMVCGALVSPATASFSLGGERALPPLIGLMICVKYSGFTRQSEAVARENGVGLIFPRVVPLHPLPFSLVSPQNCNQSSPGYTYWQHCFNSTNDRASSGPWVSCLALTEVVAELRSMPRAGKGLGFLVLALSCSCCVLLPTSR